MELLQGYIQTISPISFTPKKPASLTVRPKKEYKVDNEDIYTIIEDFPDYYITSRGEVVNYVHNRNLTLSPTENGDLTVGLMLDGQQYRRSVKVLVARAFVHGETEIFNTPIQLDGNKNNLCAENIVWRPRWFAWKYSAQFTQPRPDYFEYGPITDVVNHQRYHTMLEASMMNGILCESIYESIRQGSLVFPTGQIFV